MKILLSLPEEMVTKIDEHCQKYNYERSEFFRALVRTRLFKPEVKSTGTPEMGPSTEGGLVSPMPFKEEGKEDKLAKLREIAHSIQTPMDRCQKCNLVRELKSHVFLWDQERVTQEICKDCWIKAQRSGSAVE